MPTLYEGDWGSHQTVTVTGLHSLGSAGWWISALIDWKTTYKGLGCHVFGQFKAHSTGPNDNSKGHVFVGAVVGGTGSDIQGGIGNQLTSLPKMIADNTDFQPENLFRVASVNMYTTNNAVYHWSAGDVARAWGGMMPGGFHIFVNNAGNQVLNEDTNAIFFEVIKGNSP
jgi:hypothetical protein